MPVIKREQFLFEKESFLKIIKCSASGQFSCEFPESVKTLIGRSQAEGNSLTEVERSFSEGIDEYKSMQTTTRKVILYSYKANIDLEDEHGNIYLKLEEISFCYGAALNINFGIFEETKIAGPKGTTYTYKLIRTDGLPRSTNPRVLSANNRDKQLEYCMDWTQEREDFFCRLVRSIEKIADQLQQLKKPRLALEIASSGKFLLNANT